MGYSLVKGIGDGEPIASERFSVGGHEWVRPTTLYVPNTALKGQGSRQVKCAGSTQLYGRRQTGKEKCVLDL